MVVVSLRAYCGLKSGWAVRGFNSSKMRRGAGALRAGAAWRAAGSDLLQRFPDQAGLRTIFASASMEYLISFALDRARRMFGSSEPNSKVISRLQCWQLV
jgi:hypothetical protein